MLPPVIARTLSLSLGVLGFAADWATKTLALARLDPAQPIEWIPGNLYLHLIRNPGAAFSMGENLTIALTCLAIAALAVLLFWLVPRVRHVGWTVAAGLLIAGVAGNLFDRLTREPGVFRGHVVDFLQVPWFAIFNVADIWITCAAVLLVWLSLITRVTMTGAPATEPAEPAEAADPVEADEDA